MREGFLSDRAGEGVSTAVAIGVFDGVHNGHRAVMEAAVKSCYEPWVFTFTGMPVNKKNSLILDPPDIKYGIMESCGIKHCYAADFDFVKDLSGEEFVKEILFERLHCKYAVCGKDFRFGKMASCGIEELKEIGSRYGIEVCTIDLLNKDGAKISSCWIRDAAANGDMDTIINLTGYPLCIEGIVEHGKKLGKKHGIPTINMKFADGYIVPKYGVYASAVFIDDKFYPAVTDIGVKPTVSSDGIPLCETHILDLSKDLYGEKIIVFLLGFLREEKKFDSEEELFEQIRRDRDEAEGISKEWIEKNGNSTASFLRL